MAATSMILGARRPGASRTTAWVGTKENQYVRALVAGAAGFLGSHLCDRLRRGRIEVLGLDNFYTGSRDNIMHLEDDPGFSF